MYTNEFHFKNDWSHKSFAFSWEYPPLLQQEQLSIFHVIFIIFEPWKQEKVLQLSLTKEQVPEKECGEVKFFMNPFLRKNLVLT